MILFDKNLYIKAIEVDHDLNRRINRVMRTNLRITNCMFNSKKRKRLVTHNKKLRNNFNYFYSRKYPDVVFITDITRKFGHKHFVVTALTRK